MKIAIADPCSLVTEIRQFCAHAGVEIAGGTEETAVLRIVEKVDACRQACDLHTLYVDGAISCDMARALAERLGITVAETGELVRLLRIKIRHCALGCFS